MDFDAYERSKNASKAQLDDSSTANKEDKQKTRTEVMPVETTEEEEDDIEPRTSYMESLVHLFKGNIGPGLFAMGDAFKNGGLIVAPILTIFIAIISIHCQHVLINCSKRVRNLRGDNILCDYADTVQRCFEYGPAKMRNYSQIMKTIVNIFICVTQLGFCCIYFVFISSNVKQVLNAYHIDVDVHLVMVAVFLPVLLPSLITNLKWLAPVSLFANICMVVGLGITLYFALEDNLPEAGDRNYYTNGPQLALFFGTAIFAFEGIALVLPLKNSMRYPEKFESVMGVLNVGMFLVTVLFLFAGCVGYMKWGEHVGGSLTLNLDNSLLSQSVKIMVSLGVLFGYPLQFFVAIQIMWPGIKECSHIDGRGLWCELFFRTIMVLITLGIAELVPALGLFISLIGALCSTALALVFPPVIEMVIRNDNNSNKGPGAWIILKNIIILILALLGFATGTYESLARIISHFGEEEEIV